MSLAVMCLWRDAPPCTSDEMHRHVPPARRAVMLASSLWRRCYPAVLSQAASIRIHHPSLLFWWRQSDVRFQNCYCGSITGVSVRCYSHIIILLRLANIAIQRHHHVPSLQCRHPAVVLDYHPVSSLCVVIPSSPWCVVHISRRSNLVSLRISTSSFRPSQIHLNFYLYIFLK